MNTTNINIGISDVGRKTVTSYLSQLLADSYALYTKTQICHWNVESPNFHSLHQMFDEQYTQLATAVDEIAERIRSLGEKTPMGLKALTKNSHIEDLTGDSTAEQMIQQLLTDHESLCQSLRKGIEIASDAGDDGTSDFLTARLEEHEKTAWMLRSSR